MFYGEAIFAQQTGKINLTLLIMLLSFFKEFILLEDVKMINPIYQASQIEIIMYYYKKTRRL